MEERKRRGGRRKQNKGLHERIEPSRREEKKKKTEMLDRQEKWGRKERKRSRGRG